MGWKDLSSWLKGGIIGGGIALLARILYQIGDNYFIMPTDIPYYILSIPVFFIATPLIVILFWFLIGALIGWIIGIIKKRKEQQ